MKSLKQFKPSRLYWALCLIGLQTTINVTWADAEIESETTNIHVTLPNMVITAEALEYIEKQYQQEAFNKPYSKQFVSREKIQQEGLTDIKEAIRDIPGVSLTETGAFGKNVTIRGLTGQRVVNVVDGIKIANQGLDHSGAGEINVVDIQNVEQIEVVKGSPAVIYDPGASGGVIMVKTQAADMTPGIAVTQKLAYDEGYDKTTATTTINTATENIAARISYTQEKSEDYKVRGDVDKQYAINRSNALNAVSNSITVKDLGYDAEALSAKLSAKFATDQQISLDYDEWIGKDIASAHGNTLEDASVMLLARKERQSTGITYQKEQLGIFHDISVKLNQQQLMERATEDGYTEYLDSKTLQLNGFIEKGDLQVSLGLEAVLDEAETAVYSEQDYFAGFANLEYDFGQWTAFAGIRVNHWETRQKLLAGSNPEVAAQLIGISGITPRTDVFEPTWAVGAQYHLTDHQNISANISRTFRNPDLFERYTFNGFIGGGLALQPEEGHHAEISWKYLDDRWAFNASMFYSDFDQYIWTKTVRRIIDRPGLEYCIQIGKCDPSTGNYNDRETDFFSDTVKYYNANQVENWGMELSARYMQDAHDFSISGSFNQIDADDPFVQSAAHPIDIHTHYKYTFENLALQPWLKFKLQTVFDEPHVEQKGGFEPYTTASIFAGIQHRYFNLNAGIRNLGNTTYRAAYSGLNGLERTYFINAEFKWGLH